MRIQKGPYLQDAKQDSITIRWETDRPSAGEVIVYRTVFAHVPPHYGDPSLEKEIVTGEPLRFFTSTGTFHSVTVTGLTAGCDYCYEAICTAGDDRITSGRQPFRTAPEKDSAISFVVTAENGGCGGHLLPYMDPIIELIRREHPDYLLSVGDITANGLEESSWKCCLFDPFRTLLTTTPFYPCVGNHEVDSSVVRPEEIGFRYSNYLKYFAFPRFYSFDYGCAHFCVLDSPTMMQDIRFSDTDHYIPVPVDDFEHSEQYLFAQRDLAASQAKWKFVVFHFPAYTSSIFGHPDMQVFCPLFEKYGVDIVFNSHAIVYERSHPIRENTVAKNGVRYILPGGYNDVSQWFRDKQNGFAAKIAGRPGYVHVSLTPYTLELQAIDYEGKLFDMLTLNKGED